ncbi:MAG: DinB family protein [Pirellulaceae bacterium]|nr:DinB family protein [Pirellulaceae bacterium]
MSVTPESLSDLVSHEIRVELDAALAKIRHCVDQLTDDQLWWRPSESMNSVANLLLHLCGNVRQWIISGVGGAADVRERQREFDQRGHAPKRDLLQQVESIVAEARQVLSETSAKELLRVRSVQGNDVTGMQAMLHSAAHFRGHVQEIVHMTRCQLGDSYDFDFIPPTPGQEDANKSSS